MCCICANYSFNSLMCYICANYSFNSLMCYICANYSFNSLMCCIHAVLIEVRLYLMVLEKMGKVNQKLQVLQGSHGTYIYIINLATHSFFIFIHTIIANVRVCLNYDIKLSYTVEPLCSGHPWNTISY